MQRSRASIQNCYLVRPIVGFGRNTIIEVTTIGRRTHSSVQPASRGIRTYNAGILFGRFRYWFHCCAMPCKKANQYAQQERPEAKGIIICLASNRHDAKMCTVAMLGIVFRIDIVCFLFKDNDHFHVFSKCEP